MCHDIKHACMTDHSTFCPSHLVVEFHLPTAQGRKLKIRTPYNSYIFIWSYHVLNGSGSVTNLSASLRETNSMTWNHHGDISRPYLKEPSVPRLPAAVLELAAFSQCVARSVGTSSVSQGDRGGTILYACRPKKGTPKEKLWTNPL